MRRQAPITALALVMLGVAAQAQTLPRPTLTGLTPSQTTAGAAPFQILVSGTGFLSDGRSVVRWNREELPTTYVPGAQPRLLANVSASLISMPGTYSVDVINYGQLESLNQLPFTVHPPPAVVAEGPPKATVNQKYSHQFAATDGIPPYTWNFGGSLPPGLLMSSAGLLSGVPKEMGVYTFQVWVVDTQYVASERVNFAVVVGAPELTITTANPLPGGAVGVAYSQTLFAQGGSPPYSNWRLVQSVLPAGLSLEGSTITGTPTELGTFRFQIAVSDSTAATVFKFFSLTISPAQLSITTASPLPAAAVGVSYSQVFAASGGTPPYPSWSLASGGLPLGLGFTVGPNGPLISGTPTQSGSFNFTVAVTDSSGTRATKSFALTVNPAALVISTSSPLPNATVGLTYSQTFVATGGATPYNWTASGLPPGLSLSATGLLSGTPTSPGTYTCTVTVNGLTSKQFTLTVVVPQAPVVSVTGLASTVNPADQPTFDVQLGAAYTLPITGTITLTFTPDAVLPSNDPSIQFSTGGRTLSFSIPAGQTRAFPNTPPAIQTGTVAGRIDLTLTISASGQDITPTPAPSRTVQVARSAPRIVSVQIANRTSTGFNLRITGYSTPRQVTQAVFTFTGVSGGNLQTTQLTVPLDSAFTTWYGGASSTPFGSSFLYTQPFTVSGDMTAIASVSVTLVNSTGSSTPVSATF